MGLLGPVIGICARDDCTSVQARSRVKVRSALRGRDANVSRWDGTPLRGKARGKVWIGAADGNIVAIRAGLAQLSRPFRVGV